MAQMVASMSGVALGGVVEVVGSNLARGEIFIASICSLSNSEDADEIPKDGNCASGCTVVARPLILFATACDVCDHCNYFPTTEVANQLSTSRHTIDDSFCILLATGHSCICCRFATSSE